MTTSTPILISPSLETDPENNRQAWLLSIRTTASSLGRAYFPDGLLSTGICDTDAEWAAANPVANAGDPPIPRPIPQQPGPLPGNAGNAAIYNAGLQRDACVFYHDALPNLKRAILDSVGSVIRQALYNSATGFQHLTIIDILTYVSTHYGRTTVKSIKDLKVLIKAPLTVHTFLSGTEKVRGIILQLVSVGYHLQKMDAFEYFET
jgi:hypothetical protein